MSNPNKVDFFTNQTEDAVTPAIKVPIGDVALFAEGVFDNAVLDIEISPSPKTEDEELMSWYQHPNGEFTDATTDPKKFWTNADLPDVWMRARLSDAGAATNVSFFMRPRREAAD